jgi:ABC-type bacteriocin/lantibiotic exporter with double-glycine peptidase domain
MKIACLSLLLLTLPSFVKQSNGQEELSVHAAPAKGLWLDVPFVRQGKNLCGAACVSMIMQYWIKRGSLGTGSSDADPVRIAARLYPHDTRGIRGSEIIQYLKDQEFLPYLFTGTLSDLAHHVERGRPLMVCVQPGGRHSQRHYLVVVGINLAEKLVLVNDPARRKLMRLNQAQFEASWKPTQNWTLLVLPPSTAQSKRNQSP